MRAYEASYAALQGINFEEFKNRVANKLNSTNSESPTPEMIEEKVEHYIDAYEWEAV